MKIAFISDIHGNKTALDAVLEDMPSDTDSLVCLGDIVGYGGNPVECVETVREVADVIVKGNHDRKAVELRDGGTPRNNSYAGAKYASEQLEEGQLEWLQSCPETTTVFDTIKLTHSHPTQQDKYVWKGEFTRMMNHLTEDHRVLAMGHTHEQHAVNMARFGSDAIILNPGSVGQPRDRNPDAAYTIVDTDALEYTEYRVSYDIAQAQHEIRDAGLPKSDADRLEFGK